MDSVVIAMWNLPLVEAPHLPRMADFCVWGIAAEPALGCKEGAFLRAYEDNLEQADLIAVESSLVGTFVLEIVKDGELWEGTAANLLNEVRSFYERRKAQGSALRSLPKTPKGMANSIRHLEPALNRLGIKITFKRGKGKLRKRLIILEKGKG